MRPSRRQTLSSARSWAAGRPAATIFVIAVLAGAFVAQVLLETVETGGLAGRAWLEGWLAIGGATVSEGQWWQVIAYGFLHAGILHLVGNALLLYMAGREVEPVIGVSHTVSIVLFGQIAGGAAHVFAMPDQAAVGFSPGAAALVAAYATTLGAFPVEARLFFLIPMRVAARWLGLAALFAGLGLWVSGIGGTLAPAGIVIGCMAGWLYVRRLGFGQPVWFQRWWFDRKRRALRIERMGAEQFLAEEVDPILEKIGREGIQSLTRVERKVLEKGRAKMEEAVRRSVQR
jgi:membrane associated rhomboid family serine protease